MRINKKINSILITLCLLTITACQSGNEIQIEENASLNSEQETKPLIPSRELDADEQLICDRILPEVYYQGRKSTEKDTPYVSKDTDGASSQNTLVLPEETMTEEQIVRYCELQIADIDPMVYQPLEDEISYEDLDEYVENAIKEWQLGDGTLPPYYGALITSDPNGRVSASETWRIALCYAQGPQYYVTLRAVGGEVTSWQQVLPGMLTEGLKGREYPNHTDSGYTDEQYTEVVREYSLQRLPQKEIEEMILSGNEETNSGITAPWVTADTYYTDGSHIRYSLQRSDLSVVGVSIW